MPTRSQEGSEKGFCLLCPVKFVIIKSDVQNILSTTNTTTCTTTTTTTTRTTTTATTTSAASTTSVITSSLASVTSANTIVTSGLISTASVDSLISSARAASEDADNNELDTNDYDLNDDSDENDMGDDNDSDVGDDDDDKAEDVINDNDLENMGEETSEEDRDAQLRDLDQILESFKEKVQSNWNDKTFKRAFKSFKNNFRKTFQNDNTLIRVMFDFSNESRPNVLADRKRKIDSTSKHKLQLVLDRSINQLAEILLDMTTRKKQ